jgi:transcription antitermination factor NusG
MFVQADLEKSAVIRWSGCRAAHGLVTLAVNRPSCLTIWWKRSKANRILAQMKQEKARFSAGDRVRIVEGPLAGYEAFLTPN